MLTRTGGVPQTGRTLLVVGGSRGIGAAVARQAAVAGHAVVLTYARGEAEALQTVRDIETAGGRARAVRADTAVEADIEALFAQLDAQEPLAGLVYSSGVTGPVSLLADAPSDALRCVLEVNVLGAMLCARAAIRRMATRRGGLGGAIVFISSRAAVYGAPREFVWYAASKGAIDSLTIGLAREVGADGIRVNAVAPGPIDTAMLRQEKRDAVQTVSPLARMGTPDEVAAAVMFLVSGAASYVTGANVAVAGGL